MRKLEWLVVKDNWMQETATFWKSAPEVVGGQVKPADIQTEVFFFPSAQVAETEGTFTNTQRMLQWHFKAAEAPGDCRTDVWFTYQLGKRLQKLYGDSAAPRDAGFRNLVFDYEHDDPHERAARGARRAQAPERGQRLLLGRPRPASGHLRRPQGRRLDHLRVLDLLRRLPGPPTGTGPPRASPTRRACRARTSSGASRGRPTAGCSTTAPPPIWPAARGASGRSGCGGTGPAEVDRLRLARLRRHQAAVRAAKPGAPAWTPCPARIPSS